VIGVTDTLVGHPVNVSPVDGTTDVARDTVPENPFKLVAPMEAVAVFVVGKLTGKPGTFVVKSPTFTVIAVRWNNVPGAASVTFAVIT
jgi:hypothetical protein